MIQVTYFFLHQTEPKLKNIPDHNWGSGRSQRPSPKAATRNCQRSVMRQCAGFRSPCHTPTPCKWRNASVRSPISDSVVRASSTGPLSLRMSCNQRCVDLKNKPYPTSSCPNNYSITLWTFLSEVEIESKLSVMSDGALTERRRCVPISWSGRCSSEKPNGFEWRTASASGTRLSCRIRSSRRSCSICQPVRVFAPRKEPWVSVFFVVSVPEGHRSLAVPA